MRILGPTFALSFLLATAGCSTVEDPMMRAGTWHQTGANAANLAAMVANPHDLIAGEAADGTIGPEAALPVARLKEDKVKPLPGNAIVQLGGTTTNNSGSSGGGAAMGSGY